MFSYNSQITLTAFGFINIIPKNCSNVLQMEVSCVSKTELNIYTSEVRHLVLAKCYCNTRLCFIPDLCCIPSL